MMGFVGFASLKTMISFLGAADIAGIPIPLKGLDFLIEVPAPLNSFPAPPRLGHF